VARVSTLAIHMNRTVNTDGAKFNAEDQLCPQLLVPDEGGDVASAFGGMHEGALLRLLAAEAKVAPEDIASFDLSFVDANPATLSAGGTHVLSGRLDNLMTVFTGMRALTDADATLADSTACRLAVFHDHEEVGSVSAIGADSQFVTKMMDRIAECAGGDGYQLTEQDKARSRARSFLLSSDSAHAIHPQWSSVHVPELAPHMNAGVTVKMMMNQRYITNDVTQHLMDLVAQRAGVSLQYFAARNDCTCGSTIGPMSASNIGVRGVDLGIAQLSMHSIREMAGSQDIDDAIKLFEAFFSHFVAIDESVDVL
jgi:aspartyl aminopeptidase